MKQAIIAGECLKCHGSIIDKVVLLLDPILYPTWSVVDDRFCRSVIKKLATVADQVAHRARSQDLLQSYRTVLAADRSWGLDHWSKHFSFPKQSPSSERLTLIKLPDRCEE